MQQVPSQILTFLNSAAPFEHLEANALNQLAVSSELLYVTAENWSELLGKRQPGQDLFLIQSGQFSVRDSESQSRAISEGDYFGYHNLLDDTEHALTLQVDSPGLILAIKREVIKRLLSAYPTCEQFFLNLKEDTLHHQAVNDTNSLWLTKPLSEALGQKLVCAEASIDIQQAAQVMSASGVSSLMITTADALMGIVTDRDIRNRVVAKGLPFTTPVTQIMTARPIHITAQRTMFDALCMMTEHNIHHLPVVEAGSMAPIGLVSATDIIRHQRGNILFLIDELAKAENLYELTRLAWQIPHYFTKHALRMGDFDIVGKVLSQATDIMTRRLITFFQQQSGPAPIDFCWLVYGSQAREDQTLGSDQDNGLLLAKKPTQQQAEYFAQMGEYVCQGLGKCGIKLCDGNVMASNPKLRVHLQGAIEEAHRWLQAPTPQAILEFNIYLDVRAVAGNKSLLDQLHQARLGVFKQPLFLAALARHANEARVPLSVFQKFTYEKGRKYSDSIDIKARAVATINNLARIYALAAGLTMPGTVARLDALAKGSALSAKDAQNLRDIWLLLNRLRWRHQLRNHVSDNLIRVRDLSSIEKHQLKAAFQSIKRAQQAVVVKFSGGIG